MDSESEEGAFASVCAPNNGRLGSSTFCGGLEERTTLGVSSFLVALVCSLARLLCRGTGAGERELLTELWLAGVMVGVLMVVVVMLLPARLSKILTPCEVGGEAALMVGGETAGDSSVFKAGSGDSE